MVSVGSYVLSVVGLLSLVAGLGFSALRIRRQVLPGWEGPTARLVEAVAAIALLIWLSVLLGAVGALYAPILLATVLLLAAGLAAWPVGPPAGRREPRSQTDWRPLQDGMTVVALALVALVFVHWGVAAYAPLRGGIMNFDSLSFHMPFAVNIAQSHTVGDLQYIHTSFPNWFYPQNSELVHAVAILFVGYDTLSIFINLGWLALALLAAWCIGTPYGRSQLTTVAAAILLACNAYLVREPGSGKNDIVEVALVLAAVAILLNLWSDRRGESRGLPAGWPLALAGLAAGLAVGTRVTAIAMVAGLTVAAIALAPAGKRLAALGWWGLPVIAGGGFWYLRNLLLTGNPLPVIESVGPISLPHPEIVHRGLPDFSIAHYFTDTRVWSDYFVPGLEFSFGELWPLVVGGGIVGAIVAVDSGRDRMVRWIGAAALLGLVVYLFTPSTAGGVDGVPTYFAINSRFAVPPLITGLALLPLMRGLEGRGLRWGGLLALSAVLVITNRSLDLPDSDGIWLGLGVAFFAVLAPAAVLFFRWESPVFPVLAIDLGILAIALVAIGYPIQNNYLGDRYRAGAPYSAELNSSYLWAREQTDTRIGIVGTTAGTLQYGYYGTDLSNEVRYLGQRGPHGAYTPIPDCAGFRQAVNSANLEYLVTAPILNYADPGQPIDSPEARWLIGEPAVQPEIADGPVTVWRVDGQLDPAGCGPENAPLEQIPG